MRETSTHWVPDIAPVEIVCVTFLNIGLLRNDRSSDACMACGQSDASGGGRGAA